MDKEFEIDVAFSLLQQDLSTALKMNTQLSDLNVFIYTERQAEIVSSDSVSKFNDVFGYKSRLVVVLYREGWGDTPYTYVEEEAIRDRKFRDKTERFLILINMTGENKKPSWVSDRTIWYDYKEFGLKGIVALIKHKLSELDGIVRPENAVEIARRKKVEHQFNTKRYNFVNSKDGVISAQSEVRELINSINKKLIEVKEIYPDFTLKDNSDSIIITGYELTLNVDWYQHFAETLEAIAGIEKAHLDINIIKKKYTNRGSYDDTDFNRVYNRSYNYNLFYPELSGWERKGSNEYVSTNNLVEEIMRELTKHL